MAVELTAETIDASYRQATRIAGAIASSLLMYIVVTEVLTRTPAVEPPAFFGTLRIVLFVAAGIAIFATTIIKGIMLRDAPSDPGARLARLRTVTIAGLALCEFPAICGLIIVILCHARADFYMLLAVSAYMMVRHFPRRGPWEEYLRAGDKAGVR